MITFCVICCGCRAKQINHTLLQLHFSSSRAHISQTLILVLFSVYKLAGEEYSTHMEACLLSEPDEKPSQWIYLGYLQKLLLCHCIAKCSANSSPHNVQRMSRKIGHRCRAFYKVKHIFSAAMCLASPESEVIIYLICSPNKLLTLIFVSQHVSSWFVIESQ